MRKAHDSPNHTYIVRTVQRLVGPRARMLDYGCGTGATVAAARGAGLDAWGVDTYSGPYEYWRSQLLATARPYVRTTAGRLPWPDASFDAVTSNQVFEQMEWPAVQAAVAEIARVLRPDGTFIALFPTADIWWEGHTGIWGTHRLARWPRVLRPYLWACHRLGMGNWSGDMTSAQWTEHVTRSSWDVRHHSIVDVRALWRGRFGREPTSLAADYMRYRLPLARFLPAPLLSWVCHKRAGRVLAVKMPADWVHHKRAAPVLARALSAAELPAAPERPAA